MNSNESEENNGNDSDESYSEQLDMIVEEVSDNYDTSDENDHDIDEDVIDEAADERAEENNDKKPDNEADSKDNGLANDDGIDDKIYDDNDDDDESTDDDDESYNRKRSPMSVPENSKVKYESAYAHFQEWQKKKKTNSFSEKVLLVYFYEMSKVRKSSTLWNTYSMLKCTLSSFHKVDIGKYKKLLGFLRKKEVGFNKRKSKEFTATEIAEFLNSAPDAEYLLEKVILVFGICGASRRAEICGLTTEDVKDTGTQLIVTIQHVIKNVPDRKFTIDDNFYKLVKKYIFLRPERGPYRKMTNRFFLNYQRSRCTRQAIGINKIGNTAKKIARYLKLPDADAYTGHCFRRTTEKLLRDSGVDMRYMCRYGQWKTDDVSDDDARKIFRCITCKIKLKAPVDCDPPEVPEPKIFKPIPKQLNVNQRVTASTSKISSPEVITKPPADSSEIIPKLPEIDPPQVISVSPAIDCPEITSEPPVRNSQETTNKTTPVIKRQVIISKTKINKVDYHSFKYSVVEIDNRRLEIVERGWVPLEGTSTVTSFGGFNDYQSAADWAEILDRRKSLDNRNWKFLQAHLSNTRVQNVNVDQIKEEVLIKQEVAEDEDPLLCS
ncbi:uncharacterized protein LOC103569249 [Microplitis demolitor]|uniref:uncharacterized protein LOC103569249 n=1 Tax=Microplitis demolitor TaxID=69319 RepID=UPI0004CCC05A|nr:uncharacterized protein LOC103569249 [Microplitis demolitor]XP_008544680.1 uncharacterized protein LOC103569249 [Microplitis demolitor]